jgi:O-antigen/teichoic acid export membrane protein
VTDPVEELSAAAPGSSGLSGAGTNEVSGRRVARGTLMLLGAQGLALAAGFLIATFLTRRLGPSDYGAYAVVMNVVTWAEIAINALFRQATIKLLAEADDWQAATSSLIRIQTAVGIGVAALLAACAAPISGWLNAPELAGYLRLYSLDVPITALSGVTTAALLGRGAFGKAALVNGLTWGGRLVLALVLVGSGLSVNGALLAAMGSSLVSLAASWYFVRPSVFRSSAFPQRLLWSYSLPLFFRSMSLQMFHRLDLLIVQALAGASAAGFYGSAQNLTIVPGGFFAVSLTQVLLASLPPLLASGRTGSARAMMDRSMRLVLCLVPFAGLAAGAASEIVVLLFGASFLPAGIPVAWLAFGAVGVAMITVACAILTGSGRPGLTLALTGPLVPLSVAGYLITVPRLGMAGAAAVMTTLAWLGAGAAILTVHRICGARLPGATMLRVALTTGIAYGIASAWHTSGLWLIGELLALAALILLCLFVLGELTRADLAFLWSSLRRERAPAADSEEDGAMEADPVIRSSTHVLDPHDSDLPLAG